MNNYTKAREKFIGAFIKETRPLLLKEFEKNHLNKNEKNLLELGQVIAEIENSIDMIKTLCKLVTNHSSYYESKGFTRVQQHRKNIEWYFNEIYILKERTTRLLKLIERRLYKRKFAKTSNEILLLNELKKQFLNSLQSLLEVRGKHVHMFSYQEESLEHIELLDVAYRTTNLNEKDKKYLYSDLKFSLNIERKKWKEIIKNDLNVILDIFDYIYFAISNNALIEKATTDTP